MGLLDSAVAQALAVRCIAVAIGLVADKWPRDRVIGPLPRGCFSVRIRLPDDAKMQEPTVQAAAPSYQCLSLLALVIKGTVPVTLLRGGCLLRSAAPLAAGIHVGAACCAMHLPAAVPLHARQSAAVAANC